MIKFNKIEAAPNWLVLKPTADVRTAIRETSSGFLIDTTWEKEKNAVVTAWVVATSEVRYQSPEFMDNSLLDRINGEAPLEYDADMEVQVGDLVYFNYLSIQMALNNGRAIVDEAGDLYCLIRYDRLYAAARAGQWIPLNGYILAERLRIEDDAAFITLATEALNEVKVYAASHIREDFWDKLQSPMPYQYHEFLQAGDIAIIREQAGKQLDAGVLAFNKEVNYVRFQESSVFARVRDGQITPNTGIVLIEPQELLIAEMVGTHRYNPMAKGIIVSSWDATMNGQEVLYKKANERNVMISGEYHTFVTDCSCVIPYKGHKILC